MMSSLIPSEKYSCSGSPDMLVNGRMAIDAVTGFGSGLAADFGAGAVAVVAMFGCQRQILIGRSIFLTLTSPPSWNCNVDPVADALVDDRGDADAARFGDRLQSGSDVHAVAIDIVGFDNDVAEVDADAQDDNRRRAVLVRRQSSRALNRERAIDRVDDARELDDRAIADQLHDAAVVSGDCRIEHGFAMPLQGGQRAGLVRSHQPRIADHVSGKNGRKLTVNALFGHELARGPETLQRTAQPPS